MCSSTVSNADLAGQHLTRAQLVARGVAVHVALSVAATTRALERQRAAERNRVERSRDHGRPPEPEPQTGQHESQSFGGERVRPVDGRTRVNALHLEGAGKADVSLVYRPALGERQRTNLRLEFGSDSWRLVDAERAPLRSGSATVERGSYERRAGGNPRAHLVQASGHDLAVRPREGRGRSARTLDLNDGRARRRRARLDAELEQLGHLNFDFRRAARDQPWTTSIQTRVTPPAKLAVDGLRSRLRDVNALVPGGRRIAPIARDARLGQVRRGHRSRARRPGTADFTRARQHEGPAAGGRARVEDDHQHQSGSEGRSTALAQGSRRRHRRDACRDWRDTAGGDPFGPARPSRSAQRRRQPDATDRRRSAASSANNGGEYRSK